MNATLLPKPSDNLHQRIAEAIAQARNLSKQGKVELAAAAWDEVEELLVETSHQQAEAKTNFEQYCEDNPWARGCRIYD